MNPRLASVASLGCFLILFSGASAKAADLEGLIRQGANPVLWQALPEPSVRDLFYGIGGPALKPQGNRVMFVEEDRSGSSPKLEVVDASGVRWKVKFGAESQAEVAANRILWGLGYITDIDYLVPELKVEGLPARLERGNSGVKRDGFILNARMERIPEDWEQVDSWKWGENPFIGTREFNALRTYMAVLNNWDVKDSNTRVYRTAAAGEQRLYFVVSDMGATFGDTHLTVARTKLDVERYRATSFIASSDEDDVDFATPGGPNPVWAMFNPVHFADRIDLKWIGEDIPLEHARWAGERLSQLTDEQLSDAFRAANFPRGVIAELVGEIRERAQELVNLR